MLSTADSPRFKSTGNTTTKANMSTVNGRYKTPTRPDFSRRYNGSTDSLRVPLNALESNEPYSDNADGRMSAKIQPLKPRKATVDQPIAMREIGKSNVSAPLAARQNGAQPNRASRVVDNRKEYSNPFNGDHDSDFERYSSSQSRRDRTHSNVASNLGRQSKATYESPSHRDSIGMKGLNVQQRKESPSPPPAPASGARPSALRGGSLFKEELSESSSASSSPIGSRSNQTNSGGEIALETLKPQERASPPRRLPEPPAPQTQKQNEKVFDAGLSSEAASEDEFEATIDPAKETERSPLHERPIVSQPNMSTVDLESGGLLRSSPATPRARKGWWGRFFDFFRKIGVKMKSGVAKLRRSP